MKQTTCGIIVITESKKILLGHSTNNIHWDVFKGIKEDNENDIDAAIRETQEESGLIINKDNLIKVGTFPFVEKEISLFLTKITDDIDLNKLECSSFVENGKDKPFPEIDEYKLFDFDESLKYMSKRLRKTFINNSIFEFINKEL